MGCLCRFQHVGLLGNGLRLDPQLQTVGNGHLKEGGNKVVVILASRPGCVQIVEFFGEGAGREKSVLRYVPVSKGNKGLRIPSIDIHPASSSGHSVLCIWWRLDQR